MVNRQRNLFEGTTATGGWRSPPTAWTWSQGLSCHTGFGAGIARVVARDWHDARRGPQGAAPPCHKQLAVCAARVHVHFPGAEADTEQDYRAPFDPSVAEMAEGFVHDLQQEQLLMGRDAKADELEIEQQPVPLGQVCLEKYRACHQCNSIHLLHWKHSTPEQQGRRQATTRAHFYLLVEGGFWPAGSSEEEAAVVRAKMGERGEHIRLPGVLAVQEQALVAQGQVASKH